MDDRPSLSGRGDGVLEPESGDICEFDGVEFDARTGQIAVCFDHESASLGVAVPTLVAQYTGVDPVSLPPMYDSLDVDALERLVVENRRTESDLAISFRYAGYTVEVDDEQLSVTPAR